MSERRVCLLTGAGGELGTDFCRRWRTEYDIVAVFRKRTPQTVSQDEWYFDPLAPHATLPETSHPVFAVQSELRQQRDLERIVDLALARFDRIDLLVNGAAHVGWERLTSVAESACFLEEHFAVNATIPVQLTAIVCRRFWTFRRQENEVCGRNVVNVSSMAALGLVPNVGLSAYSASKAALNMLTGHLAEELRPIGIRVNALAPTSFPQRIPTATVSDAVVDLDRSGITGSIVQLDEHGTREIIAPGFPAG